MTKPTGGAFTKSDLDAILRARGVDTLVVAGIMTHLAVAMGVAGMANGLAHRTKAWQKAATNAPAHGVV